MKGLVGIRREDKSRWERRVPLTPRQVEALGREGVRFVVQPSTIRAFSDDEYRRAGAEVSEDLSACNVVFGVKEMPSGLFREGGAYAFFSHTIKGQAQNMPMLRRLADLGCHLIDYEKIVDEAGRRLIFFGNWAGLAGMIDTLWALGRRLEAEGVETPFGSIRKTVDYAGLEEAKQAIRAAGEVIRTRGLPGALAPLVVGFAGYGNVSRGAQEILDLLPVEEISPASLLQGHGLGADAAHRVYKVVFREEDMVAPRGDYAFDLQDYYDRPERYEGVFERYLPRLDVLVNCIYWDERYPRLVTKEGLRRIFAGREMKGMVIGDISCDVEGGVEVTLKTTDPGQPAFAWDSQADTARSGPEGPGVTVVAVDNLPAELPVESSTSFGEMLSPFVAGLAAFDFDGPLEGLPGEVRSAVILHGGRLTPDYRYMDSYLD
jgi:alpha-aminoadipic semialdehyde synthase